MVLGMMVAGAIGQRPSFAAKAGAEAQAALAKLESPRGICAILGDRGAALAMELARASELVLYVQLPDASWEVDPGNVGADGNTAHEAIWVDYFATGGRFDKDTEQLFDAYAGRAASTGDGFDAPLAPAAGTLWAVAHDNRGGASWIAVPLHVN